MGLPYLMYLHFSEESMNNLVSIIVPVYNVEKYISACVESIIDQTYKNIQIIIINDGSTDASEKICKDLLLKDKRIELYSKDNGGLSSARNYGLKFANGDYVAFIDSDDYISSDFISNLMFAITKHNADIAMCKFTSNGSFTSGSVPAVHSSEYIISRMFDIIGYRFYAWNKLYKRELFDELKYPEGETYEDIVTTYSLFKQCKKIATVDDVMYFYRIREGSITNSMYNDKSHYLFDSINFVMDDLKKNNTQIIDYVTPGYLVYFLSYVNLKLKTGIACELELKELRRQAKNSIIAIVRNKGIFMRQKFILLLICISPRFYSRLYSFLTKSN